VTQFPSASGLVRSPWFWFACLVAWFGTLWILSSRAGDLGSLPAIPGIDKVAHFGYFFGGAGLFSAFLFRLQPERPNWFWILGSVLLVFSLIGWLDEFHQSHVPGRNGNDLGDWLADICGAICGALVFRRLRHFIL
jgi:VanZ family protein